MAPKDKNSDSGYLVMSEKTHKVIPLNENVKTLHLGKEKHHMLRLLRPMIF